MVLAHIGAGLALVVSGLDGLIAWLVKPALDDIFMRQDYLMLKLIPLLIFASTSSRASARYGQSYLMAAVGERVIAQSGATSTRTSRPCRWPSFRAATPRTSCLA